MVFNEDKSRSYQTDHLGKTNPVGFKENELITLSHPSYSNYFLHWKSPVNGEMQVRIKEKIIQIEELVVSAQRWEQNRKEIPNKIVTIGPRVVEFSNPQTTADMLGQTGQVFIQKSQLGGGSPIIRGFAANSVLIVVDGVRMNNAIFRGGNLQNVISIDPLTLESTEVLFGPGSVMYGSDALGGVLHFRTKSPGFIEKGKAQINGSSVWRYSSANHEKTGHFDLTVRSHKISNFTSLTYSDFEDLTTGSRRTDRFPDFGKRFQYVNRTNGMDIIVDNPQVNEQLFSGYQQINFLHKIRYRLGTNADIGYTFNYSTTSDIPRYDRLIEMDERGYFKSAQWFYGPQKWMTHSLQTNVYGKHRFLDAVRLIMAWQALEESRNDRDFGSDVLTTRKENVDVLTANLDLEKKITPDHEIFYGLEWFYNDVVSTGVLKNLLTNAIAATTPRYPDGGSDYSGLAGYISYKWRVSEKFVITSGLRYNRIWLNGRLLDTSALGFSFEKLEVNNGAVNGNLGLIWLPDNSWQLNLLYSTGFRAANIDDIGKIFDGSNGIVTVPNPLLRPEFTYNSEFTVSKTVEDKLKISATGYFTLLDNAIIQDNFTFNGQDSIYFDGELSKVQALVNTKRAHLYGGSFQVNFAFNQNLNLTGSFTISEGEDSEGRPLRHTVPNFGMAALSYRYQKLRCQINTRFSGKRAFEDLSLGEQQKTHLYTADGALGWHTLNFEGSYRFNRYFTLNTGVENIFDLHYRPYTSGISAPGRNFILSLKAGF